MNILSKQLLMVDKRLSYSVWVGLTTPHCKIQHVTKCCKVALDLQPCKHGDELLNFSTT